MASALRCKTSHEPETNTLLHLFEERQKKRISIKEAAKVLRSRDAYLQTELESNWMLGLVINSLAEAFPNAKFILTVRDPASWVESEINQEASLGHIEPFGTAKEYMFGNHDHNRHERLLLEKGFYSLSGYLSYWPKHNRWVLKAVPPSQLLVIRTRNITPNISKVAKFIGCDAKRSRTHAYKRPKKKYILEEMVDPGYLDYAIEKYTSAAQKEIEKALSRSS